MSNTQAEQKVIASRHIPDGYRCVGGVTPTTMVYYKDYGPNKFISMGFRGRAIKPSFHYAFRTEAERERYTEKFLNSVQEQTKRVAERRAARVNSQHTLKVGDILVCSWGYDQTNIDYYQVTKLIGKTMVEVRSIRSTVTETMGTYQKVSPVKDMFFEPRFEGDTWKCLPLRKKVSPQTNSIAVHSFASAYPWDGRPDTETHPLFGR